MRRDKDGGSRRKMLGRAQGFGLRLDARALSTTTPHRVSAQHTVGERRDVRPLSREPHDWGLFNSTYFIIHWKRKAVPDPICRLHGLRRNTQHILWLEITTEWQLRMSITRMRRGIERNSQPKTRRGGLPSTLRGYRSYCGTRLDGPSAL